ncbi:MAG: hypothetical protein JW787_12890 [Sedimentisphaerales bacterium]|nr:hypothetical protein [Sedimentisphaerales bacterium]
MTELKYTNFRILLNVISFVSYILALSFVLVLYGIAEDIVLNKKSLSLSDPAYWIKQFQESLSGLIFVIACQFIAASLIIRNLSLKKLCSLTFVCIVISHWLDALLPDNEFLFIKLFVIITVSLIVPILILAKFDKRKTPSGNDTDTQEQVISTSNCKNTKYWFILDIFIIGLVLFWGFLLDPLGIVSYVSGLHNDYTLLLLGLIYPTLIVLACLSLLILIIRMFMRWPKYISNTSKLQLIQKVVIISLFVYLVLPFLPIMPSPKKMYVKGFEAYVKNNADISEIRNWFNSLSQEDYAEYESKGKVPWRERIAWPEAILELYPTSVALSWDKNYNPQVRLRWGSGVVGPWGFVVLNENIPTNTSEISCPDEYRHEIQNGVYVWCSRN